MASGLDGRHRRGLPNFLVIGTGRAGTTSLYHYLAQHPQIFMSPVKEPKFFALEGHSLDFRGPGASRPPNAGRRPATSPAGSLKAGTTSGTTGTAVSTAGTWAATTSASI